MNSCKRSPIRLSEPHGYEYLGHSTRQIANFVNRKKIAEELSKSAIQQDPGAYGNLAGHET